MERSQLVKKKERKRRRRKKENEDPQYQWFSFVVSPGDTWQLLKMFLVVMTCWGRRTVCAMSI
jgi:hypothetical protein